MCMCGATDCMECGRDQGYDTGERQDSEFDPDIDGYLGDETSEA